MFDDLIDGISKKLKMVFWDEKFKIYSENQEQEFDQPCFYINLIQQMTDYRLGPRRSKRYKFDVMYFNDELGLDDLNRIGDTLTIVLELIDVKDKVVRAFDIEYSIKDDRLHCFVEYPVITEYIGEEIPKMTDLNDSVGIKMQSLIDETEVG